MSRTSSVPRTLLRAFAGMALATALIGCGPSTHPEVAKPSDAERLDGYTAMETGYTDPEFNGQFNTEEYSSVNEAGFVSTLARPLSTVSADVDTASYANLRRMINDGSNATEIPSGAVRIEEMLNYFDYAYPAPTGDDLFSITAQLAPCPWNADTQLLTLGFATSPEATSVAEAGSNLVFLVAVSGSMESRDKLDLRERRGDRAGWCQGQRPPRDPARHQAPEGKRLHQWRGRLGAGLRGGRTPLHPRRREPHRHGL